MNVSRIIRRGNLTICICDNAAAAAAVVADHACNAILDDPKAKLGLATGGTPVPVYEMLLERQSKGLADFRNATTFNLDEYVGLSPEHPQSFAAYMRDNFFTPAELNPDRTHLPPGIADDIEAAARDYEDLIERHSGIDWQLLGIGNNGHIAFNEPGSLPNSRTRVVNLTQDTVNANSRFFEADEEVPRRAVTMGIGTILRARAITLLAVGPNKAGAVAAALERKPSLECPASWLQQHADVTFVLDDAAAGGLCR
ncbi:MAG: glucosamine-6-phosphate deaminase [Planctomycetota bacterium]